MKSLNLDLFLFIYFLAYLNYREFLYFFLSTITTGSIIIFSNGMIKKEKKYFFFIHKWESA